MNNYFRVYTNNDIIGVEIGAALKNVIALSSRNYRWTWIWG